MNTPISSKKTSSLLQADPAEENVETNLFPTTKPELTNNSAAISPSKKNEHVVTFNNVSPRLADTNYSALRRAPEIFAPENQVIKLIEILRNLQIEFCSADISQATANGYQIQESLKEQHQRLNESQIEADAQRTETTKTAEERQEQQKIWGIFGFIISLIGLALTPFCPALLPFAVGSLVLSAVEFVGSYIPKEDLPKGKNIFGETVPREISLGTLVELSWEFIVSLPFSPIRVEGQVGDNKNARIVMSRAGFTILTTVYTLLLRFAIIAPTLITSGVQVFRSFKEVVSVASTVTEAAKTIAQLAVGAKAAAALSVFVTVGQTVTAIAAICYAIANIALTFKRKDIANMEILIEEIQKIITKLQTQSDLHQQSFQNMLGFMDTLRNSLAIAIARYIEPSIKIIKQIA